MTIQELENLASRGFKRDDESGPSSDEIMACIEIRTKAAELTEEIQKQNERWDKDVIKRKTSSIIWFCARLAGMYGVNLEEAMRIKADENNKSPSILDKPVMKAPIGKNRNEKTFYLPRRKPAVLSKAGKFRKPTGPQSPNPGPSAHR